MVAKGEVREVDSEVRPKSPLLEALVGRVVEVGLEEENWGLEGTEGVKADTAGSVEAGMEAAGEVVEALVEEGEAGADSAEVVDN